MLELPDSVIDCGMKYTEEERKDFFYALIMFSYFRHTPKNLSCAKWKDDFQFFASDLIRVYEDGLYT